jgi:hypothetical protein
MSVGQENIIDWHTEATAVIADVKQHVKTIEISEKLITGIFSLYRLKHEFLIAEILIPFRCWHLYQR